MSIAHLLEDFSTTTDTQNISISDVSLEEQRLESFESGYKAGWEDAVTAARDDASRISSDFADNLRDISVTLQEAQSTLLSALRPLLAGMVNSILPRLTHHTLGARVLETLEAMMGDTADGLIEIVTAPQNIDVLQQLLDESKIGDVRLIAEPSLSEGQVHVRAAGTEQEINLDAVLAQIDAAMTGFFEEKQKDTA